MPHKQPNFISSRHYIDVAERFLDVGFWNADMTTGDVRGTDGFFRILGLRQGEAFNLHRWTAMLHPEDREDFRSIYSVVTMGVSVSRDRPSRWIRIAVEEPTTMGRIVGTVQDIAVERVSRATLYRERARLNAFIDMTGGIFWARDMNGVIADLRGWEKITGQDQDGCRDDGWLEAVHPDDRKRVEATRSASVRDMTACELPYRLRYPDGVYRQVVARTTPVRQENGALIEWLGIIEETWRRDAVGHGGDTALTLWPQQLRAARVLLGWSVEELAREAGVSIATIRRYETSGEHVKEATLASIAAAFERAGLVMTRSATEIGLRFQVQDRF